jgi:hypothetical protein
MKNSVPLVKHGAGRVFVFAVVVGFTALFFARLTLAGEDGGRRAGDHASGASVQSKIYGTIEKLPQVLVGTWVVRGREIIVTRDTVIKEKHGKPEVGAYVEVEGSVFGNAFTAYEIEVKRSK